MWELASAVRFLNQVEAEIAPQWHCALAGGVLHRGQSAHDLDVVVFPHDSTRVDLEVLRAGLERVGMTLRVTAMDMHRYWLDKGLTDQKFVEVWKVTDGSRVDVLVLK